MGIFKRLFGSDETPPDAPTGDPYRGAAYVEVPAAAPVKQLPKLTTIWDSWTRVLSIERDPEGPVPIKAIVYDGEDDERAVRRVTLTPGGAAIAWSEPITRDQLSNHLVVCVEERVIIPRATGVVARHVVTGEICWELPHPAAMIQQPVRFPEGDLLFVFADQSWMRLQPRDGAFVEEGTVRTEDEANKLRARGRPIVPAYDDEVSYGQRKIELRSDGLRVMGGRSKRENDRPGPTTGEYPIDEWSPDDYIDLVGDKLVVWLEKKWDGKIAGAIGLFEPTSLEPLRLIELGATDLRNAYTVDGLLVIDTNMTPAFTTREQRFTTVIIDTNAERVLAYFIEGAESVMFDEHGESIWSAIL